MLRKLAVTGSAGRKNYCPPTFFGNRKAYKYRSLLPISCYVIASARIVSMSLVFHAHGNDFSRGSRRAL
jgi:hypothetical protein